MMSSFNDKDVNNQILFPKVVLKIIFIKIRSDIEIIYNFVVIWFYNLVIIIAFLWPWVLTNM